MLEICRQNLEKDCIIEFQTSAEYPVEALLEYLCMFAQGKESPKAIDKTIPGV